MYPGGSSILRQFGSSSSVIRSVTSRLGWGVESSEGHLCHQEVSRRGIWTSVIGARMSEQSSKGSVANNRTTTDGFSLDNLDTESKEKLMKLKDVIEKNAYYEKYKAKIVKAQQSGPMEFLAMLEGLHSSKPKSVAADYVPKMTTHKKRNLNEVMKVELLMELGKEDITFIWQEYHQKHGLVAACLPGPVYDKILARTSICDIFVLPLARKSGHDFHVVQFSNHTFYFTPLVSWQAYKENSPVSLTLTYYDELRDDKDVVLMRGEFDKNVVSLKEAQNLAVQLHLYYAEADFERNLLMEKFVSAPAEFAHDGLIQELERMKIEHAELFTSESKESGEQSNSNTSK